MIRACNAAIPEASTITVKGDLDVVSHTHK